MGWHLPLIACISWNLQNCGEKEKRKNTARETETKVEAEIAIVMAVPEMTDRCQDKGNRYVMLVANSALRSCCCPPPLCGNR